MRQHTHFETPRAGDAGEYPSFSPDAPVVSGTPDVESRFEEMKRIEAALAYDGEDEVNKTIPAGYTYLGQLIAHDMTFNPTLLHSTSATQANIRTPLLDLDCLYGGGPLLSRHLYERPGSTDTDPTVRLRFRLGGCTTRLATSLTTTFLSGRYPDIPRFSTFRAANSISDSQWDPRYAWEPLIADPRNDDNIILSQLVAVFLKFHNKVVEEIADKPEELAIEKFRRARCVVENAYRNIVRNDYLKRILDPDVFGDYATKTDFAFAAHWKEGTAGLNVPKEFAHAAMRFGHFMIRGRYVLNDGFDRATDGGTGAYNPTDGRIGNMVLPGRPRVDETSPGVLLPISEQWVIDWRRFFEYGSANGTGINFSRKLTMTLPRELAEIASLFARKQGRPVGKGGSLIFMDLIRAMSSNVMTGQDVAKILKIDPIDVTRSESVGKLIANSDLEDIDLEFLRTRTPLLIYILAEAEQSSDGEHLGILGSTIVAETVFSLLAHSKAADETPDLPNDIEHVFGDSGGLPSTMPELLEFVG